VFTIAAALGYLVAAAMMDRMGRKPIQILGFAMMAATFGAMALIPNIQKLVYPFLIVYGISYFFTEFGPNSTTFVYPAEIFPVKARTTVTASLRRLARLAASSVCSCSQS